MRRLKTMVLGIVLTLSFAGTIQASEITNVNNIEIESSSDDEISTRGCLIHKYGYSTTSSELEYPDSWEKCFVRVTTVSKECENCGHISEKVTRTQLKHTWRTNNDGFQQCTRCDQVTGMLDLEVE